MEHNKIIDNQLWASGFFLTEVIPDEIMDPDTSWDDFDKWIGEHIADPYNVYTSAEVWDMICELASYKLSTERYGL
jgi:hypothetical protein